MTTVNNKLPPQVEKKETQGYENVAIMYTLYNWTITTTGATMMCNLTHKPMSYSVNKTSHAHMKDLN